MPLCLVPSGKYMQMMSILKPIAFDVIHCASQLFDYYLYAVYAFFGRNDMVRYYRDFFFFSKFSAVGNARRESLRRWLRFRQSHLKALPHFDRLFCRNSNGSPAESWILAGERKFPSQSCRFMFSRVHRSLILRNSLTRKRSWWLQSAFWLSAQVLI